MTSEIMIHYDLLIWCSTSIKPWIHVLHDDTWFNSISQQSYKYHIISLSILYFLTIFGFSVARSLAVVEKEEESLQAPLSFFVEVGTYTAMMKAPPPEQNLEYKRFQGVVLTGVVWLHIMRIWNELLQLIQLDIDMWYIYIYEITEW